MDEYQMTEKGREVVRDVRNRLANESMEDIANSYGFSIEMMEMLLVMCSLQEQGVKIVD